MSDQVQVQEPAYPRASLFFFGTIFPFAALVIELLSEICRSMFYDPLPTPWYAAMFAAIPLVNLWIFLRMGRASPEKLRVMLVANACTGGIAAVFSLFMLPVVPFALIGSIFLGLGSLGLAPYFALACAIFYHRRLVRLGAGRLPRSGWLACGGALAGVLLAAWPEVRVQLTLHWLDRARSTDEETRRSGIASLRDYADESMLRDACRGTLGSRRSRGFFSPDREEWVDRRVVQSTSDPAIFYLVTGRALSEAGESESLGGRRAWFPNLGVQRQVSDFRWNETELVLSRLDGVIEADGAQGYLEWMLEIGNATAWQNLEAWADLQLPVGGFVSRLTLWVEGEEREAAFAAKEKATAAYQSVVQTRRDPVLVTTRGPDRIRMRCFPVPPKGSMKMRIGITFPLQVAELGHASFLLPSILESSFKFAPQLRHLVWLSSDGELNGPDGATSIRSENTWELRAELPADSLNAPQAIRVARHDAVENLWTEDPRSKQRIRAQLAHRIERKPTRLLLVVESSSRTRAYFEEIAASLEMLPADLPVLCWIAGERVEGPGEERGASTARVREILATRLRNAAREGGVDQVPALLAALREAADGDAILRVHAPQPVELSPLEGLKQHYDRSKALPRLIDVALEPGADLVLRTLDGRKGVTSLSRTASLRVDLERAFRGFTEEPSYYEFIPEVLPEAEEAKLGALRVSDHLARLWAHRRVFELIEAGQEPEAKALALLYQLVTPLTGAVVLETEQQYEVNDLEPVDPSTVPSIPEPEEILLLVVAGGFLLWAWRRRGLA